MSLQEYYLSPDTLNVKRVIKRIL